MGFEAAFEVNYFGYAIRFVFHFKTSRSLVGRSGCRGYATCRNSNGEVVFLLVEVASSHVDTNVAGAVVG
ncbi:hypothetical protein D3C76_1876770 [compost metagenome]